MILRLLLAAVLFAAGAGAIVTAFRMALNEIWLAEELKRRPIRSTKADAKRAAHAYAESVVGHPLRWKRARQLLAEWERDGWRNPYAGGDATAAEESEA